MTAGAAALPPDEITQRHGTVEREFPDHFGTPISLMAGDARQRKRAITFIEALPSFGDYQDAMRAGAPFLFIR